MKGIKITGTGSYAPPRTVSNQDYTRIVDTSDQWITTRTGIKSRHFVQDEPTWLLGYNAAVKAMEAAGVTAGEIDLLLVTTVTSDFFAPSLACILQGKLEMENGICMDVNCGCAGFVYALDMARRYIACGDVKTALIVSCEALTKLTNFADRSTCVLFGDGAGACVVQGGEGEYACDFGADGKGASLLYARTQHEGNPFYPLSGEKGDYADLPDNGLRTLYMDGKEVYKFAVKALPKTVNACCEKLGVTTAAVDKVIPHQANLRIIKTAADAMDIPMEKMFCNIDRYGNTSSASIPIALDEAVRSGFVREGELVALAGFGAGVTYGSVLFRL